MRRRRWLLALAAVVALGFWSHTRAGLPPRDCPRVDRAPRLWPDYTDLTIPPNIAPLCFRVAEPGTRYHARLAGPAGPAISLRGRGAVVRIPLRSWRRLLAANTGQTIAVEVSVRDARGRWSRFAPVRNQVAREPIDSHLVYRWFRPTYSVNTPLGLYQRDLTSFAQRPILRSPNSGRRCLNCHAFADGDPKRFSFQVRGRGKEAAMLLADGGRIRTLNTRTSPDQRPAAVTTWHPGGRWVVASRNWIRQYFHEAGSPGRDALDAGSGLLLIDTTADQVTDPAELNPPSYLPTFPCWSPDGRWLYFSRVKRFWPAGATMPVAQQEQVRYDLVRAPFDSETGRFGAAEMVVPAAAVGKSILHPRVSPDGRWLVACLAAYGGFPIFRAQADLAIIDLRQRPFRAVPLDAASGTRRDTWHSWSRNSRWLVCSRKADNGLFARPYLRYIAPDGTPGKAFRLPQADPELDDRSLYTYNLPELVTGPVALDEGTLAAVTGPVQGGRDQDVGQQEP